MNLVTSGRFRTVLALVAGVGISALVGAPGVPAHHIPSATYTGTVGGGGTVTMTVAADGSTTSYAASDMVGGTCSSASVSIPSLTITDHQFTRTSPSGSPHVSGDFATVQGVSGTVRAFGACDTGTLSWSATTDANPPDTTAPVTMITGGPDGLTNDPTPTFTFTSESNATFECRIDSTAFEACFGSFTPSTPLSDGPHTFEVKATDAADNTEDPPKARQFTVDTTPPDTGVFSGPNGPTNDATPTFDFGAGGAVSFTCQIDSSPAAPCTSPYTSATLPDGPHTFSAAGTDAAGNTDPTPAQRMFSVDTTPPETFIDGGPPTTSPVSIAFHASEPATFQCSMDGAGAAPCTSPMAAALAPGLHSFTVIATDAVGNADPSPAAMQFSLAAPTTGGGGLLPAPGTGPIPPTMPSLATATLVVARRARVASTVSRGLPARFACPIGCAVRARLLLARKTARKLKIAAAKTVVVGRGRAEIASPGVGALRVRFTSKARKRLKRVRRVKLTLRVTFAAMGLQRVVRRRVTLARRAPAPTVPGDTTNPGGGGTGTPTPANRAPVFPTPTGSTAQTSFQYDPSAGYLAGATTTVTVTTPATDPDGDPLAYSWAATNGSVQGNGLSAIWQRSISFGQPADGDLVVTASDGRGGSDTFTFEFR